ncbi:MAG TPA: dockerin type I domain-containing protein [Dehalococcoidia bacterium]|nr:dockerin type I domain-containing protein [Dehalococcoidia bacterium]
MPGRRTFRNLLLFLLSVLPALLGFAVLSGSQAAVTTPGPAAQCVDPQPGSGNVVFLPGSGPPASTFQVDLSGVPDNRLEDQPVVVIWDLGLPDEAIVGEATIPATFDSTSLDATVPADASTGEHRVTVCWQQFPAQQGPWYRLIETFIVTEPTPTPTPTPSPTPTPTATPSPTPTPTPSPTPPLELPLTLFSYFKLNPRYLAPLLGTEDLSIFGIEMTEAIQCFDTSKGISSCANNSLPLVTQKNAAARIYLKYTGAGTSKAGIPVRMHFFAGGKEYIADTSGTAWKTVRQDSDTVPSLWFNVDFTNDVDVYFYAEVDPDHLYVETNEGNNRFPASGTQSVSFQKRASKSIVGLRTRYHPSGYAGSQYAGGWAVNGGGADWLEYVWPVRSGSGIDYSVASGYLDWTTSLSDVAGEHALISALNASWIMQNYLSFFFGTGDTTGANHVYGWVNSAGYSGGHADMPIYPHAGGLGVVGIGSDAAPGGSSVDSPGSGALIFGHELTHDYNVYHTNTSDACGSNDGNSDFPYGNSSIQEFGFNPDTGKVYDPSLTHDLMSYCPSGGSKQGWISPFTWNKMFGDLSGNASTQSAATAAGAGLGEGLAVNAMIDNPDIDGDQGGSLGTLFHHDVAVPTILPPTGDYAIELRNSSEVLASQPFEVNFESEYSAHDGPGDPSPLAHVDVSFIMAWNSATTSVALVHNGKTLDEVHVSAHAPQVDVTSPAQPEQWTAGSTHTLSWTAGDADGDPLTYSVFYSNDGTKFEALAAGLTTTSYPVDVDSIAGGGSAKLRVVASDGINTGFGDSAAVSVPNKAPMVDIASPSDGTLVAEGGLLVLDGSAADLEDGAIPDAGLSWFSDKDGALGTGSSLPVNTFSPGLHTITLRATDSDGAFSEESIQVLVGLPMHIDVQPDTISKAGAAPAVTIMVTLPPGYPTLDIDPATLRLVIGAMELTPTGAQQLGDTDNDGLPELSLTFDGAAVQAALPETGDTATATLNGKLNDGTDLQGSDVVSLTLVGDADCNGNVNSVDALGVLRSVAGLGSPACLSSADVDCSGAVNSVDALKILRHVAGLPQTGLPQGCSGIVVAVAPSSVPSAGRGGLAKGAWLGVFLAVPALVAVRRRRLK